MGVLLCAPPEELRASVPLPLSREEAWRPVSGDFVDALPPVLPRVREEDDVSPSFPDAAEELPGVRDLEDLLPLLASLSSASFLPVFYPRASSAQTARPTEVSPAGSSVAPAGMDSSYSRTARSMRLRSAELRTMPRLLAMERRSSDMFGIQ